MEKGKLEKFTERIISDVNAAMSCLNLYIGHRLDLFKALQLLGDANATELADYSHTNERYINEWLECMAAGVYIDHDTDTGKFSIPPEHALALTRQDNPYYMAAFLCWIPAMHDMAYPGIALRKMKDLLVEDGAVLIAKEAVCDNFDENKNFLGHLMYNFSVLHCLPQSMVFSDSAAIGTVFNPSRIKELAVEAGFSRFEILPVENDFWHFYQLKH